LGKGHRVRFTTQEWLLRAAAAHGLDAAPGYEVPNALVVPVLVTDPPFRFALFAPADAAGAIHARRVGEPLTDYARRAWQGADPAVRAWMRAGLVPLAVNEAEALADPDAVMANLADLRCWLTLVWQGGGALLERETAAARIRAILGPSA
jgi:hypothetical protein